MPRLIHLAIAFALIPGCLLSTSAGAQTASSAPATTTIRAVLASTRLPSVVDAPRHFVVRRISVPARQTVTYNNGAVGIAFTLSGSMEMASGADRQAVRKEEGVVVPVGSTRFSAVGSEPAVFLHFVLLTADELNKPTDSGSLSVIELFRTVSPIPGLKPGPYEFTMVRVTFPPRFPINPPHRRSGAAVYYFLSGTGMFTTGGKTVPKPAGAILFEPYDLVHQWENPGDAPFVIIQLNISQEGVPAVIFVRPEDPIAPK